MSQPKFTKGPWRIGSASGIKHHETGEFVVPPSYSIFAGDETEWRGPSCIATANEANAHLITAAPKLYDKLEVALRRLVEKDDGSNRDLGLISGIEAVLEEARGEL